MTWTVSQGGTLYCKDGLNFGMYRADGFIQATEQVEQLRPGSREEIIAEAYWNIRWLMGIGSLAFIAGLWKWESILIALAVYLAAHLLEVFRFYIFGTWVVLSYFGIWVRKAALICAVALAYIYWESDRSLSYWVIAFVVVELWLGLAFVLTRYFTSLLILTPLLLALPRNLAQRHQWRVECDALTFAINKYRDRILPASDQQPRPELMSPDATLRVFAEALRKGDIEKARSCFSVAPDAELRALATANKNRLVELAHAVETAEPFTLLDGDYVRRYSLGGNERGCIRLALEDDEWRISGFN